MSLLFPGLVVASLGLFLIALIGAKLEEKGPLSKGVNGILIANALALFLAAPILAGFVTPRAVPCWISETGIHRAGPVALPDPSQGLNQFLNLRTSSVNLTLKLCTTYNLQFYVGLPDECARLGEPYGDKRPFQGEPTRGSECPDSVEIFLAVTMSLTASIALSLLVVSIIAACQWVGSRCSDVERVTVCRNLGNQ